MIRSLASSLVVILLVGVTTSVGNSTPPNIILIVADDLGWRDVGAYGNDVVRTPNLDRLASQGLKFDNAFLTSSSCSASRATILSGLYPHSTGVLALGGAVRADVSLLGERLKSAGYFTARIGKWHIGDEVWGQFHLRRASPGPSGTENWLEFLGKRPKDKPFFFYLASNDPHRPFDVMKGVPAYDPDLIPLPEYLPDFPESRKAFAAYYQEISRLDNAIGDMLDYLQVEGVLENTFIVFMSDNGAPFSRAKLNLYDSGIKTPLIFFWPEKLEGPSVSKQLVSSIDIVPTLMSVAGLEADPALPGKNLFEFMDTDQSPHSFVFAEQNDHGSAKMKKRAVRTEDWLYIRNFSPQKPLCVHPAEAGINMLKNQSRPDWKHRQCLTQYWSEEELYDVNKDPYQLKNLADRIRYRKTRNEFRQKLDEWIKTTEDSI
jgi:arylsulfatase A-like enzyme